MFQVDQDRLLENVVSAINRLEYDSSRGDGKTIQNAGTLVALYTLKEQYTKKPAAKKPATK